MLRMYAMDKSTKWEEYLHLMDFTYNNGHQKMIEMSLFEALYGIRCRALENWDDVVNILIVGLDMLKQM